MSGFMQAYPSQTTMMARLDVRALDVAIDELQAYIDTVGEVDEAHGRIRWTIKRLELMRHRIEPTE